MIKGTNSMILSFKRVQIAWLKGTNSMIKGTSIRLLQKKLRPKRSKSFPKKEQYSSKTTEKIVNLENSSYVKNESNKNNAMHKNESNKNIWHF